jgi:hypothetical protein
MAARCIPRRQARSRQRSARAAVPLVVGAARTTCARTSPAGFVQAAIDTLAATGYRPPWLSRELLAVLEARGRLTGIVYLLHFDRPIGDVANPRGFASHYTGWTLDLPARLVEHAAGRGARLMAVVGELGIGWQLARVWRGPRALERSLKQRGAARRCPVCHLACLGLDPGRPADLLAFELGARAAGLDVPELADVDQLPHHRKEVPARLPAHHALRGGPACPARPSGRSTWVTEPGPSPAAVAAWPYSAARSATPPASLAPIVADPLAGRRDPGPVHPRTRWPAPTPLLL